MSDETEGQVPVSAGGTAPAAPDPSPDDDGPAEADATEAVPVVIMDDTRCQCVLSSALSLHERQALADELRRAIMRL